MIIVARGLVDKMSYGVYLRIISLYAVALFTVGGCGPSKPNNTLDKTILKKIDLSAPVAFLPLYIYGG